MDMMIGNGYGTGGGGGGRLWPRNEMLSELAETFPPGKYTASQVAIVMMK